jgi:hypothetical protein
MPERRLRYGSECAVVRSLLLTRCLAKKTNLLLTPFRRNYMRMLFGHQERARQDTLRVHDALCPHRVWICGGPQKIHFLQLPDAGCTLTTLK